MHRPFEILEDWVREGKLRVSDTVEARTDPEPSTPPEPVFESLPEATDREAFEAAMKGVTPLKWNEAPAFRAPRLLDISPRDGEAEILRILEDFCRNGPVGPEQTREYVEHFSDPLGRLYIPDLRSGQFAVQAHLDLHGLTLERARRIVDLFVRESVNAGYSCVRIVHGRGRHSEEGRPLLKENVERWLRHRRMARWVIAYTSARAVDGGGGAVYVLLRPSTCS